MIRRSAILAAAVLLAEGCGRQAGTGPAEPVRMAGGVWMLPTAARADGCPRYRKYVPGALSDTAIYYRRADGAGFTSVLERSECMAGGGKREG